MLSIFLFGVLNLYYRFPLIYTDKVIDKFFILNGLAHICTYVFTQFS